MRAIRGCALVLSMLGAACSGGGDDDDDDGVPTSDPLTGAWIDGFALPGPSGAGAQVYAALTSGGTAWVGGLFDQVGGIPARNVARWDGTTWTALGEGLAGPVHALALDSAGRLVAGGELSTDVEPNRLFAFDGAAWAALPGDIAGSVYDLAVQGSSLLVAGVFNEAGGTPANAIARYAGGTWTALSGSGLPGTVYDVEVVDADTFCIGGFFDTVDGVPAFNAACSDAGTWSALGDGLNGTVYALERDLAGDFVAGGEFSFILDPMTGEYRAGLASLVAGAWEPLAGGVDGGFVNSVRAIHVEADGDLVIGGTFELVGKGISDVPASNLARLSGSTWAEVGGGVDNLVGVFLGSIIGVNAVAPLPGGELLVAGVFSHAGDGVASNAAVTAGGTLQATVPPGDAVRGVSGFVDALAFDAEGRLIAGGSFTGVGHLAAENIARLGASGWEALGGGIPDGIVRAIVLHDGALVAGGEFDGLRRFDGADWSAFAPGVSLVFDLAVSEGGTLYAGGDFDEHVRRWNGESWESLDGGVNERVTTITFDHRGRLVAGGLFDESESGVMLRRLGRFSGGEWHAFGGGLDGESSGYVTDIERVGDDLLVAGWFAQIDGVPATSIARWDGDAFHPLGAFPLSFGIPPTMSDVAPYGGGFFVTGTFTDTPDGPASFLAWFDGATYHPLGAGLSDLAEEIHVSGATLWVGGAFLEAGERVSSGLAAWAWDPASVGKTDELLHLVAPGEQRTGRCAVRPLLGCGHELRQDPEELE